MTRSISSTRARTLALWVACMGSIPTSDLPEVCDMSRDVALDALRQAIKRGWVRRMSRQVEALVVRGGTDGVGRWCWKSQPVVVPTYRAGELLKAAAAGRRE